MAEIRTIGPRFISNQKLDEYEAEDAEKTADEIQADPFITSLGGHIRSCWQEARDNKDEYLTDRLLKSLRLRKGEYSPSEKAAIDQIQGDSGLFDQLVSVKCRAAEAWLNDILLPPGEKPWGVSTTPNPQLAPPEMQKLIVELQAEYERMLFAQRQITDPNDPNAVKEAERRIERELAKFRDELLKDIREKGDQDTEALETDINDGLVEGGWYKAIKDVIPDIVTFPTGFVKGPVVRMKKTLNWGPEGQPVVETLPTREYDRVSPFDIYPSPTAKTLQDSYLIQKHRFERKDLNNLIGVDGYDELAIRKVLIEHGEGGLREWLHEDDERSELEDRPDDDISSSDNTIDCLEFWGSVQGQKLMEWGLEEIEDAEIDYDIDAFMIGSTVIGARLNPDPLGKKPYFSASFTKVTDSIWGTGVPEILEPKLKVVNGCLQSIVRNMSMASGPMVGLDMSQLDPSNNPDEIYPLKVWQFDGSPGSSGFPITFFQPDPIIDVLLKLYDYFYKQAGEDPGIPNYMYGAADQGGAAKTASGLSMLMNASAKVLKTVAGNIDEGIIKPSVEGYWQHIMLNEPEKATGDIKIVPRASEYLVMMEQLQIRRQEFLQTTANQFDFQIMGLEGRAEVLRETLKSLKIRPDKVVPSGDSFRPNISEQELMMYAQNLSQMFHVPPEQILAIAKGGAPGGQAHGGATPVDVAGTPQGGQQ
jgi:hypothetical protein